MATYSTSKPQSGSISGGVFDVGLSPKDKFKNPIADALVELFLEEAKKNPQAIPERSVRSQANGQFDFDDLDPGDYWLRCKVFALDPQYHKATVEGGCITQVLFGFPVGFVIESLAATDDCEPPKPCDRVTSGRLMMFKVAPIGSSKLDWGPIQHRISPVANDPTAFMFDTRGLQGSVAPTARMIGPGGESENASAPITVTPPPSVNIGGDIRTSAQRSGGMTPTADMGLWLAIRTHAKAISFGGLGTKGTGRTLRGYQGFIEQVLCEGNDPQALRQGGPDLTEVKQARLRPMHGMAAYELLRTATEIFLLWNCGVAVQELDLFGNPLTTDDEERIRSGLTVADVTDRLKTYLGTGRLPYIERVVQTAFPGYEVAGRDDVFNRSVFCTGVLTPRADNVCLIELIWSYWHEEGMLAQSMNAISQRFQNVRSIADRDPLAHVTIDPLRPLNNLLWGYVQDEQNRLTVKRRGAEYDHEYGITLRGKALPPLRPADSRSKFLEGFHNLLHMCSVFYKEDNDTTVIADAFPLLKALREVHLLLAQGAHNQFGDLPWTARVEMLMQQWLLARPEMRDFLQSRPMVPYTEAWMPQVDTMKTLQGWSDVTVTHFHDLASFGEQILLSVRYGDWIDLNDESHAKNWARYWRPEIQSYIHAYRTVTGIDLTNPDTVDYTMPAVHLQKRLAMQRAR